MSRLRAKGAGAAALILALLFLGSCAALSGAGHNGTTAAPAAAPAVPATPRSTAERYVEVLRDTRSAYSTALRAAGAAHARKLLTDEQLSQAKAAGHLVEDALLALQAALDAYLTSGSPDQLAKLQAAAAAAQGKLSGLLLAGSGGT